MFLLLNKLKIHSFGMATFKKLKVTQMNFLFLTTTTKNGKYH